MVCCSAECCIVLHCFMVCYGVYRLGGSLNCQVSLAIWPYFCRALLQKINLLIAATHTALAHPILTVTRMCIFVPIFLPKKKRHRFAGAWQFLFRRQAPTTFLSWFFTQTRSSNLKALRILCWCVAACCSVLQCVAVCCSIEALRIVCW